MAPWSASISGSISGRSLIRVYPQLGAGGAVEILRWLAEHVTSRLIERSAEPRIPHEEVDVFDRVHGPHV